MEKLNSNIHSVSKTPPMLIEQYKGFGTEEFVSKIKSISNELKGFNLIDACSILEHVKIYIHEDTKV